MKTKIFKGLRWIYEVLATFAVAWFAVVVLLMVTACATAPVDRAPSPLAECSATVVAVQVKMYDQPRVMNDVFRSYGNRGEVKAFATYDPNTTVHTLHVPTVYGEKSTGALALLGHELLHAGCGDWH